MKIQAIGNNYRTPSFGVQIAIPSDGVGDEIRQALQECPAKEDLNRTLNRLAKAEKYKWSPDNVDIKLDSYRIKLGKNYSFTHFPKDGKPFIILDNCYREAPGEERREVNEGYNEILYAYNPTNGVKIAIPYTRGRSDALIVYKFLTSLCNTDTPANKYFWQELKFDKFDIPDEDLSISPEKHKIFTDELLCKFMWHS